MEEKKDDKKDDKKVDKKQQIQSLMKYISQDDPNEIFNLSRKVGKGSYGTVYKGIIVIITK